MKILLASPRGFCAGVDRAIGTVLGALNSFGAPVYVRKQIVHNDTVVRALSAKGAVFVDEVDAVPVGATIILSAHGVAPEIYERAFRRSLNVVDATCPLVTKVHVEARRFARRALRTIIVGHSNHEEVVGTLGYTLDGTYVVCNVAEAEAIDLPPGSVPAVLTQTTFSLDDATDIVKVLRRRFPDMVEPARNDICYATQNRQTAVREIVKCADVVLVLGARNSSNSNRLLEIAVAAGVRGYLLEELSQLRLEWLDGASCVGITSGASTPEHVVTELVDYLCAHTGASLEIVEVAREDVTFAPPSSLIRSQRHRSRSIDVARRAGGLPDATVAESFASAERA